MGSERRITASIELDEIDEILRKHSRGNDPAVLDSWLVHATLSRFEEWVPRPSGEETRLLDIGCYQPAIGYYAALGWREIIGIAKEEGECNSAISYQTTEGALAQIHILDIENDPLPVPDASVDVVLMMEILEHFGLDPMQALAEANRVLKVGGLLVLSTPNACSSEAVHRLLRGENPHLGLEFSGYSTNRHNRLYDCHELQAIAVAAGFDVDLCTSRTYGAQHEGLRRSVATSCMQLIGKALARGRQVERGDYLFLRARKRGPVFERYPSVLYWDTSKWPQWYKTIREKSGPS